MSLQAQLSKLIELREHELERRRSEVAGKQQVRDRFLGAVNRLEALHAQLGSTVDFRPEMASNAASYKLALQGSIAQHRQELALREAELATAQQGLLEVARKQEANNRLVERLQAELRRQGDRAEQKRQDEMAAAVWFRRQAT